MAHTLRTVRTNFGIVNNPMPDTSPIRSYRFNLGHVGSLSDVIAPARDDIPATEIEALKQRDAANIMHLLDPRINDGKSAELAIERSARLWRRWQADAIVQPESTSQIFVYHQSYVQSGMRVARCGIVCGVRHDSPDDRPLYHFAEPARPHIDRQLELMERYRARFAPVVGLYSDAEGLVQQIAESAIRDGMGITATDPSGVQHTIWPIHDSETINRIRQRIDPSPLLLVAGNEQVLATGDYLRRLAASRGPIDRAHPAHFMMTLLLPLEQSAELLQPTHRILHDPNFPGSEELVAELGECFTCNVIGHGPSETEEAWHQIASRDAQGQLVLYCPADQAWVLCDANASAIDRLKKLRPGVSDDWCELSVNLLHHLILTNLLGLADATIEPTRDIAMVEASITRHATAAALLPPVELESLETCAVQQELLPASCFHVKPDLAVGLIMQSLEA